MSYITAEDRAIAKLIAKTCPICGWEAKRSLLPSMWAESFDQLANYIERVQGDLRDHLLAEHVVPSERKAA